MPNPGRPSGGCITCKARRVKCDETKPVCQRCTRANRLCGGYRDPTQLVFRSQNETLGRRKLARKQQQQQQKQPEREGESSGDAIRAPTELEILNSMSSSLQPALTPTREQQALYSFFTDFGIIDRSATVSPSARGFLEVIADVYKTANEDSHLVVALRATSMANLGNRYNSTELQNRARAVYGKALGMTNQVLRDREKVLLNETLAAVHVLGLFETIMCTDRTSWYRHVDGMCQIVRMRGPEMLRDPIGLRIFFTLRNQILVSSMTKNKLVFDYREPAWQRMPEATRVHPANTLTNIMAEIPVLQGELKVMIHKQRNDPLTSYEKEIQALIDRTDKVDAELEEWKTTCPQEWAPIVHHGEGKLEPRDFWKDCWHEYLDIWKPAMWNQYRISKILISVILWYLLGLPSEFRFVQTHSPEKRMVECVIMMRTMIDEICYSVPYELGYTPGDEARRAIPLGGYLLVWPLGVAISVRAIGREQKEWIKRRLDYMSDVVGLKYARSFKTEGQSHFEQ